MNTREQVLAVAKELDEIARFFADDGVYLLKAADLFGHARELRAAVEPIEGELEIVSWGICGGDLEQLWGSREDAAEFGIPYPLYAPKALK